MHGASEVKVAIDHLNNRQGSAAWERQYWSVPACVSSCIL